nr:MAG TPA: Replication associated protein [Microviridae sp.]
MKKNMKEYNEADYQRIAEDFVLRCDHPLKVSHNGVSTYVPCGQCDACRLSASSSVVRRIKSHALRYRYCYFVTLTYADNYLPKLSCLFTGEGVKDQNGKEYRLCSFYPQPRDLSLVNKYRRQRRGRLRTFDYEDIFEAYVNFEDFEKQRRHQKAPLNMLYYAPSKDLQLFFKRLRYEYKLRFRTSTCKTRFSEVEAHETGKNAIDKPEEISYFAVSEYGTEKGRPHWHILLFFNTDYLASNIAYFVNKAWGYGIADTQLSRGECASYLASYLQGTISCGGLFRSCPQLRPKRYQSFGFGDLLLPKKTILSKFSQHARVVYDGIVFPVNGSHVLLRPSWSSVRRLFFRPKSPHGSDSSYVWKLFSALYFALQTGGMTHPLFCDMVSITDLSNAYVVALIKSFTDNYNRLPEHSRNEHMTLETAFKLGLISRNDALLVEYLDLFPAIKVFSLSSHTSCLNIDSPLYKMFVSRVYRLFSAVRRSCMTWNITSQTQLLDYAKLLADFWKEFDVKKLDDFYRKVEFYDNPLVTKYLYNDFVDYGQTESEENFGGFEENPIVFYSAFLARRQTEKVKHHKDLRHKLSGL